jgi:hypothetical protein
MGLGAVRSTDRRHGPEDQRRPRPPLRGDYLRYRTAEELKETYTSSVPTILFGDPDSLLDKKYSDPMCEYDNVYYLNCGALVPWRAETQPADSEKWTHLKDKVCRQKIEVPPPNHEWRSVFSQGDLEAKTRTIVENIRLRLLGKILSGQAILPKAEATLLAESASIPLDSAPQIEGPSK